MKPVDVRRSSFWSADMEQMFAIGHPAHPGPGSRIIGNSGQKRVATWNKTECFCLAGWLQQQVMQVCIAVECREDSSKAVFLQQNLKPRVGALPESAPDKVHE
jgi:hypothetical protein